MSNSQEIIAPGTMILWGGGAGQYAASANGAIAFPGWLYCDGSTVPYATYGALFAVISTLYNTGGEPAGTFRLPGTAGYMHKGTLSNVGRVSVASANHSHTAGALTAPIVNSLPSVNNVHSHSATSAAVAGGTHGHVQNASSSGNNVGNVGRSIGNTNGHLVGHTHNTPSAANGTAAHGHNFAISASYSSGDPQAHNHGVPTIASTAPANYPAVATPAQPTIEIWHIIKT